VTGPFEKGEGEGVGVHLLTGPVVVEGAEPGDVLEVRILEVKPRPSCNHCYAGRCFGSNAAASWGFHYRDLIEEPKPREVVTIFELDTAGEPYAKAVYNYVWTPQTDPDGVVHPTIDYPGVKVDHTLVRKREDILRDVRVPARLHFGTMGLAPSESDFVSSIPPATPAATSTTGALARARACTTRWPCRAPSSRSGTRMRPRGTANWVAPRSRPR
jgi:acetamidase/formamidase